MSRESLQAATRAWDELNHALAAAYFQTVAAMTDEEARRADQLMREHPEWGWLDAAVQVEAENNG